MDDTTIITNFEVIDSNLQIIEKKIDTIVSTLTDYRIEYEKDITEIVKALTRLLQMQTEIMKEDIK